MGIITSIALNYVQRKMLEDDPCPETVVEKLFCAAIKLIQYGRWTLNIVDCLVTAAFIRAQPRQLELNAEGKVGMGRVPGLAI